MADPTPARSLRSRTKTPLPALSSRQSFAYGAQRKADLKTQVRPAADDFNNAFGQAAGPAPSQAGSASPRPHTGGEDMVRVSPPRNITTIDQQAQYAESTASGDGPGPVARRVLWRTLPRYVPAFVRSISWKSVLVFLTLLLLAAGSALAANIGGIVFSLRWTEAVLKRQELQHLEGPPSEWELRWHRFKHDEIFSRLLPNHNMPDLQWAININFLRRMEKLEERMTFLEGNFSLHSDTLAKLQETLPSHVVLRVVDGEYEIPNDFWKALQERLTADKDLAPLWQGFLTRNERQLQSMNREMIDEAVGNQMEGVRIATVDEFTSVIERNNEWLAERYHSEYRKLWQSNVDTVREVAKKSAKEVLDESPTIPYAKEQLEVLVQANHLHNTYESLRGINWFSAGLGNRIDPRFTSPTMRKSGSWIAAVWGHLSPLARPSNPPIEALKKWDEVTDCWCSARSKEGEAQLSVILNENIYPDQFVIEHIPSTGALNIAAAPKDFEIWAAFASGKDRRRIQQAIKEQAPYYENTTCGEKPAAHFVCLGKGSYNVHHANHIQVFQLFLRVEEMPVPVRNVVVKVTSNWGADHTCLYRLRMTGQRVAA